MSSTKKRKRKKVKNFIPFKKKNQLFLPSSIFSHLILPYLLWWKDWKIKKRMSYSKSARALDRNHIEEILKCFNYTVREQQITIQTYLENVYRWDFTPKSVLKCKYCLDSNMLLSTMKFNFTKPENHNLALKVLNYYKNFNLDDPIFFFDGSLFGSFDDEKIANYDIYINFLFHRIFYIGNSKPVLSLTLREHLWNFNLFTTFEFLSYEANFKIHVEWDEILKYIHYFKETQNEKIWKSKVKVKDVINVISKGKNVQMPRELQNLIN